MDHGHKNDSPPVKGCQADRDFHEPLLEPLIAKILKIGSCLDDLERLVALKAEEINRHYESACLLTKGKASKVLDVSESQLGRLAENGEIAEIKLDRRPRYALVDLRALVDARRISRRARLSPRKTIHGGPDAQRKPASPLPFQTEPISSGAVRPHLLRKSGIKNYQPKN